MQSKKWALYCIKKQFNITFYKLFVLIGMDLVDI